MLFSRDGGGGTYRRKKFTIIELLIVIALIAILAAMLLPALQKAKNTAKGMSCVSQFKQVSTAFYGYFGEYNDCFPPLQYGTANDSMSTTFWIDLMQEDLNMKRTIGANYFSGKRSKYLLLCPSVALPGVSYQGSWSGITTGYNQTWTAEGDPGLFKKVMQIRKPSFQLLHADVWLDETSTTGRQRGRYRLPGNQHIAFRHSRKATALYLDGHATLDSQKWLRLGSSYCYPLNRSTTDTVNNNEWSSGSAEPLTSFAPFD